MRTDPLDGILEKNGSASILYIYIHIRTTEASPPLGPLPLAGVCLKDQRKGRQITKRSLTKLLTLQHAKRSKHIAGIAPHRLPPNHTMGLHRQWANRPPRFRAPGDELYTKLMESDAARSLKAPPPGGMWEVEGMCAESVGVGPPQ